MLYFILLALTVTIAWFIKWHYSYWQRRGMPCDQNNTIPWGCLKSVMKHEKSMGMAINDVYLATKEKFVGIYLLYRPAVLVRDVDLVRHILVQDFNSFHDRGVYVDEERDPLSSNIFALPGKSWRTMRQTLAPAFTSGKLRGMFGATDEIGKRMIAHLNTIVPETGSIEVDLKEIFTTYAIDVIGSVIFGLDINSFEKPKNTFRTLVHTAQRNNLFNAIVGMLVFLCPSVAKFIFRLGLRNEVTFKLREIIKDTIEYREEHNIIRKDMLQLLMQLRNTGKVAEDDDNWSAKPVLGQKKSLSLDHITAQAFIFYIAGQETTASTAAFTLFELAQYPDLLTRAQKEVENTLKQNDGHITYDTLKEMPFLEMCISETLRKYPGLPILNRECTQDYKIPDTDKFIEKGTAVVIPLFGIHRNPNIFPNPITYDPERFLPSNPNYNVNAYMPFGAGPRHCIAQRLGVMDSKLAVVKILQHFNVEIMEKREIEIDNHAVSIMPKGGVKVRLSKRN